MNQDCNKLIDDITLNRKLVNLLKRLKEQGTELSDDSVKKVEQEFWKLIKPALGEKNWEGNNYKGSLNTEEINKIVVGKIQEALGGSGISKETILKPLKEIFGKKNFDDDEYIGGWNEEQDTKNIKKVVGEKNFVNGELSIPAGWDKEKDLQNLKDNKSYLSDVVKESLGDFKKEVDNKFEKGEKDIQNKLQEADSKISEAEKKLDNTATEIKKGVEDKLTETNKQIETKLQSADAKLEEANKGIQSKLQKADEELKTKLGEVDNKLTKSDTDIKEKLKGVDTKLTQADEKINTKLAEVDKKFEPYKTWDKTKEDIIPVIIENLENKKPLWQKFQDNLDKENFYPEEEHQDTTPGREGMWKNQADIAKQQARFADEIANAKLWVKFFKDHNVASNEESIWEKRFPANPEGAEDYYTDAILRAAKIVGTKKPLNDLEKNAIKKSPTPDKVEQTILNIPKERTKEEWMEFFEEVDLTNQIKSEWRTNWEESGLNRPQAEIVYKNGWMNDPAKGVIKDGGNIETYTTTHYDIDDNKHEEITKNVNPLIHIESELVKCHTFIFKRILAQRDLTKFPDDAEIQDKSRSYDETQIPESRNYERTIKLRDKTRQDLFKKYFQGENSAELSDEQIEAWRISETGLPMTGKDQRKAFDNGWIYPNEIKGGKTEYQGVKDINVLKYKKTDVDKEIATVQKWIEEIKGYTKLRQMDSKIDEINEVLLHLNNDLLPKGSKERVDKEINDAREKLNYYLGDPEDGGIEDNRLNQIEQAIKIERDTPTYDAPTVERLEAFINASKNMGLKIKDENRPAGDITDWLKSKGAYVIPKAEITDKEDLLDLAVRGQYLIPFCYKKAVEKGGYEFKPDNLTANSFCKYEMILKKSWWSGDKYSPVIDGEQGHLPFPTGSGKSTKVITCICRGGMYDAINEKEGRNIIMVVPTQVLVEAVYGHHNSETGWLQDWGCVKCQYIIQNAKVKKGTYKPITEEEIAQGVEWETKNIFKSHGKYKVVKNDLLPKGEKGLSIITGDELAGFIDRDLLLRNKKFVAYQSEETKPDEKSKDKKRPVYKAKEVDMDTPSLLNSLKPDKVDPNWFSTPDEITNWIADIQKKIIDKENDIIIFDEGDFAIPAYKALQKWVIAAEYKVVRMSATFENQPFSITSTYQRDNLYVGKKLDPTWKVGEWNGKKNATINEFLATAKIWFFLPHLDFNPDQIRALGNISWIAYTDEWDEYVEPVSYGMPKGSWSFVRDKHSVGMNPDADGVILGGKMAVKTLEGEFKYRIDTEANLTQADGTQMIGRVARSKKGKAFLLSLKWEPIDIEKDVAAAMVESMFDGEVKHMSKMGYKMIQDINMLRLALALPKKFGKPLEEILIGLNVNEKDEKARADNNEKALKDPNKVAYQPLTKIKWRTANEKPSSSVDADLWDSYAETKKPPQMKVEVAKNRLLECITTYIREADGFPKKIKVWKQSSLIEFIWGGMFSKKDSKGRETLTPKQVEENRQSIITEIRQVLNGVIKKGIDGYGKAGYDKATKTAKDRKVIEEVAQYYKIADANIDVSYQFNTEKTQKLLTLMIEKN